MCVQPYQGWLIDAPQDFGEYYPAITQHKGDISFVIMSVDIALVIFFPSFNSPHVLEVLRCPEGSTSLISASLDKITQVILIADLQRQCLGNSKPDLTHFRPSI